MFSTSQITHFSWKMMVTTKVRTRRRCHCTVYRVPLNSVSVACTAAAAAAAAADASYRVASLKRLGTNDYNFLENRVPHSLISTCRWLHASQIEVWYYSMSQLLYTGATVYAGQCQVWRGRASHRFTLVQGRLCPYLPMAQLNHDQFFGEYF